MSKTFASSLSLSIFLMLATLTAAAGDSGLLWKAQSPEGTVIYLFGTIHTDDPRVNQFSNTVLDALRGSDNLVIEVLPVTNSAVYFMQDARLEQLLDAKSLIKVRLLADQHAIENDVAMRLKPWLLAMVFDLPRPQSPFTMDAQLLALANQQSKKIIGIESKEEHFGLLDNFTRQEQITMLKVVLQRTQKQKERDFEALIKAYLAGDIQLISKLDDTITQGALPYKLWQKMKVKLIDERNQLMAERIVAIDNSEVVFVAIGAAHLPGEQGVIARLRAKDYKVDSIDLRN